MNRFTPLAAAAAALCMVAGTAQAQSSVSAYGLLDMSVGRFQTAGSDKTWRAESGNMTTSFFGFKGVEDLGGGLKARFTIESFLRADNGAAGRFDGDRYWARNATVGLEGAFGTTLLGRNTTPLFVSTLIFNPFGDSFGFSPAIRHTFLGAVMGDTGWNNSVRYSSPNLSGASIHLMGNLAEAPGSGKNLSASVLYFGGPLAATVAWQDVKNGVFPVPAGFDHQRAIQFGASYDFGAAKLYGQYADVKTDALADTTTKLVQIGASLPLGLGAALVSYGRAKAETGSASSTRKTLTAGYDYNLSKSTDIYAVFMNDKATGLDTGNTLAAGVRMKF